MSVPRVPERIVQAQVVRLLRSVGASVWVLGTRRSRAERDHGTHQTPGISDLVCLLPRGLGVLFVEVKAQGGRRSTAQLLFAEACAAAGVGYVCGGVDQVLDYLESRGLVRAVPHYRRTHGETHHKEENPQADREEGAQDRGRHHVERQPQTRQQPVRDRDGRSEEGCGETQARPLAGEVA